jgi:hypothetical protein
VTCPTCGTETVDGRCAACAPETPTVKCPKCRAAVPKTEKFCDQCGAKIPTRADRIRQLNQKRDRQENAKNVNRGRTIMLWVAILTLFAAAFQYFAGMSQVDKSLKEPGFSTMTPAERDQLMKDELGMTWSEAIDQARGEVRLVSAVSLALGLIFFGLWWWAQHNPFGATLSGLLLYVTVMMISFVLDPKGNITIALVIKVFIIVGLSSAVSAAYKERQRRRIA